MTIFGDPFRFAVQFVPLPVVIGGPLPECHFTYRIGGRAVGNFHLDAPICEVEGDLLHILADRGHRRCDALFARDAAQIVREVDQGMLDFVPGDHRWSAHKIDYYMGHGYPPGSGERWRVYLVEDGETGRILFQEDVVPDLIHEMAVPAGLVDEVLTAAWRHIVDTA